MKSPEACENMADIRAEIDRLDQAVIALWGQRLAYVKAAAPFKTSEQNVKAPERLQTMLQQRRQWASAAGLDPDIVEQLYRELVHYFIAAEMQHWQAKNG